MKHKIVVVPEEQSGSNEVSSSRRRHRSRNANARRMRSSESGSAALDELTADLNIDFVGSSGRYEEGSSQGENTPPSTSKQEYGSVCAFFHSLQCSQRFLEKEASMRDATFSRILRDAERTASGNLTWLRKEAPRREYF